MSNINMVIFGITGQDGSYLAESLLRLNKVSDYKFKVHGVIRRSSNFNTQRIDHIFDDITLHYGDLTDPVSTNNLINKLRPFAIFNLAAQSHVGVSFEMPYYTSQVDGIGTLNILEAIRNYSPSTLFYQASTSELFGKVQQVPQNEETPFYPRSPYGVAKLYSYWITKNYREAYNLKTYNGILFNHESPRRGNTFVTKKISRAVANINHNRQEFLELGNLDSQRDWGYAPEYVEGMISMVFNSLGPDDYVLATGKTHTIRKFCNLAFNVIGMELQWSGKGEKEVGVDKEGIIRVKVSPRYFRPAEVDLLVGDASKAKEKLGWEPKVELDQLVKIMVEHDMKELDK